MISVRIFELKYFHKTQTILHFAEVALNVQYFSALMDRIFSYTFSQIQCFA